MLITSFSERLKEEEQRSVVYITRHLATAYCISDSVAAMRNGAVRGFGDAKQLMSDPQRACARLLLNSMPTTPSLAPVCTRPRQWRQANTY